jgi:hypothetical protein
VVAVNTLDLAAHEFAANFLYNDRGLDPWFACDSIIKDHGGATGWRDFSQAGDRFQSKLYYHESGIDHPGDTTPAGTPVEIEDLREFRIQVRRHPETDPLGNAEAGESGEQTVNFHLAPRWPGMSATGDDGESYDIPVPDGFGEGVNVSVNGSNLKFHRYPEMLAVAAAAVGLNPDYFTDRHPSSNVRDAERYVRLHADESGPVHARDGPIAELGHLLEADRSGYRKLVQDDTEQAGHYHTATLGPKRVREAFPDHRLPVEVKHYYGRESADMDADETLANPKVGVSYQVSRWDSTLYASDEDLTRLERELDRVLLSVLADAGLDVAPEHDDGDDGRRGPFVPDAYFTPEVSERGPNPIALELTQLEHDQESVVIRHLADGFSPVQWDALETLATDGGEVAPGDIADENDRHINSVYRALQGIDDLLDRARGEVALGSDHIADMVIEAVREAREQTRQAVETAAKAEEAVERGLTDRMSAFVAFCSKHGIDHSGGRDARLTLRFGDHLAENSVEYRVKQAFDLWTEIGRDREAFVDGWVEHDGGRRRISHYLDLGLGPLR